MFAPRVAKARPKAEVSISIKPTPLGMPAAARRLVPASVAFPGLSWDFSNIPVFSLEQVLPAPPNPPASAEPWDQRRRLAEEVQRHEFTAPQVLSLS